MRLVGIVPSYREGPLTAGAVRSLLPHVDTVLVYEGPVGDAPTDGEPTDLREFQRNSRVVVVNGAGRVWKTEAHKRNAMLAYTRRLPKPTWGVYVDSDEVIIGAEYLREYIWAAVKRAADGEDAVCLPLNISEVDGSVGRVHRVIRLDKLEAHVLSMSQLKFYGSDIVPTFPVVPVWRPGEPITATPQDGYRGPILSGTPHLHHRAYYRPPGREGYRLHAQEIRDFDAQLGIRTEVPGSVPVEQDPGFVVANEMPHLQSCGIHVGRECDCTLRATNDPFGILKGTQ